MREEWVVYSAHRNNRPWQGAGLIKPKESPEYSPDCYLCPGNSRVLGIINPNYSEVLVFENDHPVVSMNAPYLKEEPANFLQERKSFRNCKGCML